MRGRSQNGSFEDGERKWGMADPKASIEQQLIEGDRQRMIHEAIEALPENQRAAIFSRLSPEQRQEARGLFREWQGLRPAQRQRIMQAFRRMRDMPSGERRQFLQGPQEQDILRGLGHLLPPANRPRSTVPKRQVLG
jgi:Protein of unknown function (DUF3106)